MGNSITPIPLTWPEINRLLDIFNAGVCNSIEGDSDLIEQTGLIEYYDGDTEYVHPTTGAEEAFLEYVPQARVKSEWRWSREALLPTEKEAINPQLYAEPDSTIRPE